jgi:hypothetical protein
MCTQVPDGGAGRWALPGDKLALQAYAGLETLAQALGSVGMVRFLQQFDTGSDDTRDRQQ